jgi:hypothetical protein
MSGGIKVNLDASDPIEISGRTQLPQPFFINLADVGMADPAVRSRTDAKNN